MKRLPICVLMCGLAGGPANAADASGPSPSDTPVASRSPNWLGFYMGGHLGNTWGRADWTGSVGGGQPALYGTLEFYQVYDASKGTGSFFSGLQGGYNYRLPAGIVLGVEVDLSFPNTLTGSQTIASPAIGQARYEEQIKYWGTVRGRLGFVHRNWLFYSTAGFAGSWDQFNRTQLAGIPAGGSAVPGELEKVSALRTGWTVGAGVEAPVAPNWTAHLQYLFTAYGAHTANFPHGAQVFDSDLTTQTVRLGLNYQFGDSGKDGAGAREVTPPASDVWSVHAQSTFLYQYAFPFRAPYRGSNSLDSGAGRETWDVTFYTGLRLWQGAEFWVNAEIDQGFGLSGTVGVAGFPSGEAYKVGANDPYTRLPRMFIRQTVGLGGEQEKIEGTANQLAGSQAKDKLVVTIGKFAVTDIFDSNKYAHDPRSDFFNWAIVDTGTFDYAADAWGFTYGAAVEWYSGPWALRAGLFDLSIVPNSTQLDPRFEQFQMIGELERRYSIWGQPGKLAATGFLSRGRMGRFSDAVRLASTTGDAADVALVRQYRSRTGLSFNLEQDLWPGVGVFARAGWANGSVEPYEFSDIDRTLAAGIVISGKPWGRADDTVGIGAVVNNVSDQHRAYLDAGGLGILVGDGMLPRPGAEKIIEAYYSFPVLSWRATLDYQFIDNPAYNRDRGPVSVFGTRIRKQF